jgi:hypothetical protein
MVLGKPAGQAVGLLGVPTKLLLDPMEFGLELGGHSRGGSPVEEGGIDDAAGRREDWNFEPHRPPRIKAL